MDNILSIPLLSCHYVIVKTWFQMYCQTYLYKLAVESPKKALEAECAIFSDKTASEYG